MLISPAYLELQRELHSRGSYGVSAARWALKVRSIMTGHGCRTLLDYGCGQGLLKNALGNDIMIFEYDPAIPAHAQRPPVCDMVYCGDVLEHVEPDCLEEVLDDIKDHGRKVAVLVISTQPAVKKLADGRNAHLIVEPARWWLQRIAERWETIAFGGTSRELQFCGRPFHVKQGADNA